MLLAGAKRLVFHGDLYCHILSYRVFNRDLIGIYTVFNIYILLYMTVMYCYHWLFYEHIIGMVNGSKWALVFARVFGSGLSPHDQGCQPECTVTPCLIRYWRACNNQLYDLIYILHIYIIFIISITLYIYISMCMYIEFSFASKKWRHELGETFDWWWSECVILMQVFHIFREVLVHTAQSNRCKSSHKPIFCNTCFVFVLESEGTPSSLPYFHRINRIFHEINHPAIGVPPLMDIPAWVWGF